MFFSLLIIMVIIYVLCVIINKYITECCLTCKHRHYCWNHNDYYCKNYKCKYYEREDK